MSSCREKSRKLARRLSEDESGTATVEVAIWMPLLLAFFLLLVDASMILYNKAQILRAVQDLNRSISFQMIDAGNTAAVAQFMTDRLPGLMANLSTPIPNINNGLITTEMVIPSQQLTAIGVLNFLPDFDIRISATHLAEF